jgi:asparagine synthase (glutamine-hydrolysing)
MCGIAGFLDIGRKLAPHALAANAASMGCALGHRGPDDRGVWTDAEAGVALAHTRLAIVDLSPMGAQPMVSSCGRFVISYNGEIYNSAELRDGLDAERRSLRGHSDTEILLELCAQDGVEATVPRLIGMFAFALWDRRSRTLALVRDRLGIKPLYWGRQGGRVLFASELSALEALPDFERRIDADAVAAYLRFAYVPAPQSIYAGIGKLAPGSILTIGPDGADRQARFWSLDDAVAKGRETPFGGSDGEAAEALDALLGDAVARRLVADVPVGAFLSGGVDSSTVAALMRAKSTGTVRTYSIGFSEKGFDEAPYARAVAEHLGTEHTEMRVSASDALGVIPDLSRIYDEPFADSSQIPTALLSRLTRRHVTVALSGDGGDELFAGYNRHRAAALLARTPRGLASAAAWALSLAGPAVWDRAFAAAPKRFRLTQPGDKIAKLAAALRAGPDAAYRSAVSQWPDPAAIARGGTERCGLMDDPRLASRVSEPAARMQYLDTLTYLPDDILTKVDRATMAVGLEARVPILDHRVVEFAWRLPMRMKLRGGETKWLLRRVLDRHAPRALFERPKAGLGIPLADWLRGPLRPWAEERLSEAALDAGGLVNPAPVRAAWEAHIAGRADHAHRLWAVLMLEDWRARRGL